MHGRVRLQCLFFSLNDTISPSWKSEKTNVYIAGATAGWREEAHTPSPWTGANTGATFHPINRAAGWAGHHYHLGKNRVFDAELCALYRALETFDDRNGHDRRYTIFSDSAAALGRIASGRLGPEQRLAVAPIELRNRLMSRGNSVAIRWTPFSGWKAMRWPTFVQRRQWRAERTPSTGPI